MGGAGGIHAVVERCKPCAAMVTVQCVFAVSTLWVKAAFGRGMNPMVLVVYRQGIATLVLAPIAITANRTRLKEMRLGATGFLVFVAALFGATANMNLCYEGLHLGSSSMATAMMNLIPAITFLMAVAVGQERVNIKEVSSIAKIFGTAVCVGGAITMAFFKGSKLLNTMAFGDTLMLLYSLSTKWVIGALLLVVSSSCWSLWLIIQAPICRLFMDPLTLSVWTCFLSTLQSAVLALFMLPDWSPWKIHSLFELSCYIFVGVLGSGLNFCLQSWCISLRGPLYSAMFTPLATVITTALAAIFLHEELHIGSLLGAIAIVSGLYIVLWGKAEDAKNGKVEAQTEDLAKAAATMESQQDVEKTLAAPLLTWRGQLQNDLARHCQT
ncbi:hypothetical protein ACP4OV_023988 [Aristida adscensionis]